MSVQVFDSMLQGSKVSCAVTSEFGLPKASQVRAAGDSRAILRMDMGFCISVLRTAVT